jgi:hypothetical protein
MENSMRAMRRTVALAFVLLGLASAPLAAQANPPPPSNPPVAQPTGPQYQGPPPQAPQAQSPQPQGPQYSSNEIVDAGHRFFGTISRELAQIVEKAGSQFGLPNGYVLGQEGGGAVVAGLRYGEGILYTKNAGDLRVFWQGPSLGYDFGVDGARTMMLVYNLPSTDAIYQRFAGIEGSAYFVGGLGMTALTMNNSSWSRSARGWGYGWARISAISSSRRRRPGTRSEPDMNAEVYFERALAVGRSTRWI